MENDLKNRHNLSHTITVKLQKYKILFFLCRNSMMLIHANLGQVTCVSGAAVSLRSTNKEPNIQNAQQWQIHVCLFEIPNQSQHRLIQTG